MRDKAVNQSKFPCPDCGSSDALTNYPNGAYCFSCQKHTPIKSKRSTKPFFPPTEGSELFSNEVVLPYGCTTEIAPEGLKWLYKHGITDYLIDRYKIGYIKNEKVCTPGLGYTVHLKHRVILPFYEDNKLVFYQARSLDGSEPKYLTMGSKQTWISDSERAANPETKTLIITEDMLSAMRVGEYYPSAALCGISLNDKNILTFVKKYATIILWLDKDQAGITASNTLKKRFEIHGTKVIQINNEREPKQCFRQELQAILTNSLSS